MSNYYASSRTNYFKVRDVEAFKSWLKDARSLEIVQDEREHNSFAILVDGDSGGFPAWRSCLGDLDEDADDYEIDFLELLAAHLEPGSVAVMMEVGAEKLNTLHGFAAAVDSTGKQVSIGLHEIYDLAAAAFNVPLNTIDCI